MFCFLLNLHVEYLLQQTETVIIFILRALIVKSIYIFLNYDLLLKEANPALCKNIIIPLIEKINFSGSWIQLPDFLNQKSRNHIYGTTQATLSGSKDFKKQYIIPPHFKKSTGTKQTHRHINVDRVTKPFLRLWDAGNAQWDSWSSNGENMGQWETFPEEASLSHIPRMYHQLI